MLTKRIVYHRDSQDFFWETQYTASKPIDVQYTVGKFTELFQGFEATDEDKYYPHSLFNTNNLARIDLDIGKNECYYLDLRKDKELREIITFPESLNLDILIGRHYDHYIYLFYNNTNSPNISILARIGDMNKEIFTKLKSNMDDITYRQYLLRKIVKPNSHIQNLGRVSQEKFDKKFLTIEELAEFINRPKGTIYNWVYKKKIPYYKSGRALLFNKQEIEDWLKNNLKTKRA